MTEKSNGTNSGTNGTDFGTIGTNHDIDGTDNKQIILRILSETPHITYDELAEKIELPRRTVARVIKTLCEKGAIRRIGTNRSGYWEILK